MEWKAIFLFSCLVFSQVSADLQIESGYVAGRSGNVIIKPRVNEDDSVIFLRSGFNAQNGKSSLKDLEFGSLISHQIGGPMLSTQGKVHPVGDSSNPFEKSTANLLFVVEGISTADLAGKNLQAFSGNSISLVKTSYPQDNIATLTTMMTGTTPSHHGIVGASWRESTGEKLAYKAQAIPLVSSVSDVISQSYAGNSMVFSYAECFQLASALGIHASLAVEYTNWNAYTLFFDRTSFQISNLTTSFVPSLMMTSDEIVNTYSARNSYFEYDYNRNYAYVTLGDQRISFNLDKTEDSLLFREVSYLLAIVESLQQDQQLKNLISDNYADLISFGLSSPKHIKAAYGESEKYEAAVALLDRVIADVADAISTLYSGRISTEIVLLAPRSSSLQSAFREARGDFFGALFDIVQSKAIFNQFFPVIYTTRDPAPYCDKVEEIAADFGFEAFCGEELEFYGSVFRQTDDNGSNTTDGSSDAGMYQISFWFAFWFIPLTLVIIYTFITMDVGRDSVIYRMTDMKTHQL